MSKEKRMIGDYTVLSSVNVGEKEIIIASNEQSTDGEKFLCGFVERNDLFEMCKESGGFLFLKTLIQSPTRALAVCIISAAKRSSKILPRDIRRKRNRAFLLRICRQEVSR